MDVEESSSEEKQAPGRSGSGALKEQGASAATANKTEEREGATAGGGQTVLRPGAFIFLYRSSHKYKNYKNTL